MTPTLIIILAAILIMIMWHVLVLSFKCRYYEDTFRKNKELLSDDVKKVMDMKSFFN